MSPNDFRPVVLITGAASGIGAATARGIAPGCAALALHTRATAGASRDRLSALAIEARAAGADTLELGGDLAVPGTAASLVHDTLLRFGRLDHIVANAGFADRRPTSEIGRTDLDRAHATMTAALLELAQAATPALKASPSGRLVYLSSFVVRRFVAGATFPATAAAKAAGEAIVKALAAELAPAGVAVNVVSPGYTRKDGGHSALGSDAWKAAAAATPMGRIAEPADIAALIAFLLSPAARHITGQVIAVDGGLSLG